MHQKGLAPILIAILITIVVLGGGYFVYQRQNIKPIPESMSSNGCRPTGCSGQVCSHEDIITTCEYRAQYACYKTAKCERQTDGKCGWTQTEALKKCIEEAGNSEVIQ